MNSSLVWLLLLILRNSLWGTVEQAQPRVFRHALYEVTIPKKLKPRYGEKEPQDINYWLQIEGVGHVVHLKQKKGFVSKHFPVFTFNKEGDLQVDYPFIRKDCYYHGFVQDEPFSLAALSTCSGGLKGLLQVENKTYGIEPVKGSKTFQHMVYRMEEKKDAAQMRCGLTKKDSANQENMIWDTDDVVNRNDTGLSWWTHTRFAKVAIVVEHERFLAFGGNETLVARKVLDIIHHTDSLFSQVGVRVALVGLVIWSGKNFITISDNVEDILEDFNTWRKETLAPRLRHDVSHLFVYKSFRTTLGIAYVEGICDPEHASGIESYTVDHVLTFVLIFAHELGHNLGMLHDSDYCKCKQSGCIMNSYHSQSSEFSNCSYRSYYRLSIEGNADCLKIPPDDEKQFPLKYCGNKIVEPGEQCDCGTDIGCEVDPCCQPNCVLRFGAKCATGQCCGNCQYRPAGTICREKASSCDFPEYCNGASEWCPMDYYVQDGTPCFNASFCYHGKCNMLIKQCRKVFGNKATVASEDCFRKVNTQGDRFGNCGITSDSYKKCKPEDILCGRIQCENIDQLPDLAEHNTLVQTVIGQKQCWGTDHHHGTGRTDIGAVDDGTSCGKDMMCIGQKCTNISILNYNCNTTKCHSRGICNNLKHCHCSYGWAPPDCLSRGFGGSVDSGPPPEHETAQGADAGDGDGLGMTGKVLLIVSPLVLVVGLVVCYRKRLRCQMRRISARLYPAA